MNISSLAKSVLNVLIVFTLVVILVPTALAKKGGGGGGKPGGGDPPAKCTDVFPGFVYIQEAKKKSPEAILLASSDGCRLEPVAIPADLRGGPIMHVTEDGSTGVILWTEEPDNLGHYIVRRVDFSVNGSDPLTLVDRHIMLPLPGGEEVPAEDGLLYWVNDIWGDAFHDSLYLAVRRIHSVNNGPTATREMLIYDLNDLADSLVLGEECPPVYFPQFAPACYGIGNISWNSSGTRLYWSGAFEGWSGAVRVNIDQGDGSVGDWSFFNPKLIYTSPNGSSADYGEASGVLVRPTSAMEQGEFLAMMFLDRTGRHTVGAAAILNADYCTALYAPYASSDSLAPDDLWLLCIRDDQFVGGNQGRQNSWQSSDDLLITRLRNSRTSDIYRIHNPGQADMSEELLVEGAVSADSGF